MHLCIKTECFDMFDVFMFHFEIHFEMEEKIEILQIGKIRHLNVTIIWLQQNHYQNGKLHSH